MNKEKIEKIQTQPTELYVCPDCDVYEMELEAPLLGDQSGPVTAPKMNERNGDFD